MEPITVGLLVGGAYMLLKKKGTAATTSPDGGRTVVNLPAAEWEAFMDDWTRQEEEKQAKKAARYGADPDTWEELVAPTPSPVPGLLGPAPVQIRSDQSLGEFIPGISDTWVYLGGAAAVYYFFLRKK